MKRIHLTLGLLLAITAATPLRAQISAFTYQGRLNLNGAPANGYYDFMFRLLNDPTNGVAAPVIPINIAVPVTNGLFTTGMDFGVENFVGANHWLEINVRTNGNGPFTTLSPRQVLTPTPYAISAITASNLTGALPAGQISGTIPNASLPASPSFSGTVTANNFSGNGVNVTNVNAVTLGGLNSSNFWRTTGNVGTIVGTHFLGTADNQPVELRVNNQRVLRLEDNGDGDDFGAEPDGAPNIVAGSSVNFVREGVVGATISGGGATNWYGLVRTNAVRADYGTVAGGLENRILEGSFSSSISGGYYNEIAANSMSAVIAGGALNGIGNNAAYGAIGGGDNNHIVGKSPSATIAGGELNDIGNYSDSSTIGGGSDNGIAANSRYATIGGGYANQIGINSSSSVIAGGFDNEIGDGTESVTIAGGRWNGIGSNTWCSTVCGGWYNNIATDSQSSIIVGGGFNNIDINARFSAIVGGEGNRIGTGSSHSAIGGGFDNVVADNSSYAAIPGGYSNSATNFAFAAGFRARANHTGAFVWADATLLDDFQHNIASTNANSVTMRASGGYRLFTDTNATTGAFLAAGSGSWTSMSDRNAKENFHGADVSAVLEKVVAIPVQTWNYKSQDAGIRHIGPMAQDFKAAFAVGESETGISTVDADGVALAAIQGLNQKLEETSAENAELKQRLTELERIVDRLGPKQSSR